MYPGNTYLFKVNNRDTKKMCEIRSKLTIKTPEQSPLRHSGIFVFNLWIYFTPFSSVSIVSFEKVNVSDIFG